MLGLEVSSAILVFKSTETTDLIGNMRSVVDAFVRSNGDSVAVDTGKLDTCIFCKMPRDCVSCSAVSHFLASDEVESSCFDCSGAELGFSAGRSG